MATPYMRTEWHQLAVSVTHRTLDAIRVHVDELAHATGRGNEANRFREDLVLKPVEQIAVREMVDRGEACVQERKAVDDVPRAVMHNGFIRARRGLALGNEPKGAQDFALRHALRLLGVMGDHGLKSIAASDFHDAGDAFLSQADLLVDPLLTLRGQRLNGCPAERAGGRNAST